LVHRNVEQDPYAKLLSGLSGLDQKPGKLLSGWQHWSKGHFDQHKHEFEEHFKSSGKSEKHRASDRQTFIRDLFKALPEEIQAYHNQAASQEHAATQQAFKEKKAAPPSEDPSDRQLYVLRFPDAFRPPHIFTEPLIGLAAFLGLS
jgi:hypothetical protein